MKSNLHELIPLIEYSRRWALENFVVTHVYSSGSRDMTHESLSSCPEASDRVLIEAENKCREYGISARFPQLFKPLPKPVPEIPKAGFWERLAGRLRQPAAHSHPVELEPACAAPWRMLKIRWNGDVHPCDLWDFRFPMGNLQTQSFQEIWLSPMYIELRSGLSKCSPTYEPCIKCDRISQDNLEKRKLQSPLAHTSIKRDHSVA